MAESNEQQLTHVPAPAGDRKLFVGGLYNNINEKDLHEHFSQFGMIQKIEMKNDLRTGRSRGYAFVLFVEAESIKKVIDMPEHVIKQRRIDVKRPKRRNNKVFVGGLPESATAEDIQALFARFGTVINLEMPYDRIKGRRKNFCFVTYESEREVRDLLKESKLDLNGKRIDIKLAIPKPDPSTFNGGYMPGPGVRSPFGGASGAFGNPLYYSPHLDLASMVPPPPLPLLGRGNFANFGNCYPFGIGVGLGNCPFKANTRNGKSLFGNDDVSNPNNISLGININDGMSPPPPPPSTIQSSNNRATGMSLQQMAAATMCANQYFTSAGHKAYVAAQTVPGHGIPPAGHPLGNNMTIGGQQPLVGNADQAEMPTTPNGGRRRFHPY